MIDIRFLRTEPDRVREHIRKKFQDEKLPLVDEIIALDKEFRDAQKRGDELRNSRNVLSKQIGALMKQGRREEAETAKAEVTAMQKETAELEQLADSLELNVIRFWEKKMK